MQNAVFDDVGLALRCFLNQVNNNNNNNNNSNSSSNSDKNNKSNSLSDSDAAIRNVVPLLKASDSSDEAHHHASTDSAGKPMESSEVQPHTDAAHKREGTVANTSSNGTQAQHDTAQQDKVLESNDRHTTTFVQKQKRKDDGNDDDDDDFQESPNFNRRFRQNTHTTQLQQQTTPVRPTESIPL